MTLISCIMPTRNRRSFVKQAIWYFIRQDYPEKELVIVDDGEDLVKDLVPTDQRIRYIPLGRQATIGEKRNIAIEASRGQMIAHWDDDDWSAPDRLSRQKWALESTGAAVVGARHLLHYYLNAGEAWIFQYPNNGVPWLAGCTLLYRRAAWQAHPFPPLSSNEDMAFLRAEPAEHIHAMADRSFCIAVMHASNANARLPAPPFWVRTSMDELQRLWGYDSEFYVALRDGYTPYLRRVSTARGPTITVVAPFMVYDGYGSMAEFTVLGMERGGANLNLVPISLDENQLTPRLKTLLHNSQSPAHEPILYFCFPRPELHQFFHYQNLFINTMWESSRLPSGWSEQLNRARAVIVPTRFVAQVCRDSGVTVPVEVIPEGINPEIYHYVERPAGQQTFTTLIVGTLVKRKHTLEGIEAWKMAFSDDPDARLVIKSRFQYGNYFADDPRIRFVDTNEATRGIMHWYQQADVLLALGSEGFGLPMVEAMATGLPVIALDSEGQSDVIQEAQNLLLPVKPERWEAADEHPFGPAGIRGVPGIAEVAERLRWVRNYPHEAAKMGRAASAWITQYRNVWDKGPAVLEVMEQYIRPSQPLTRSNTFWVPSWGQTCGIAEYTADLARELNSIRIVKQPGDINKMRLMHVQHEYSLFNQQSLLETLIKAKQAHLPVAVTEHTVVQEVNAWERECDILLALTRKGTTVLKSRWPEKNVQYLPMGCPTWFPQRKKDSRRVIGVFGFLERYKGYWQLLEVLRRVPGTELLMFSYAKGSAIEAEWDRDSAGLPVRRYRDYLPVKEVATQLAAQADILVFWYDQFSFFSASAAVRVALATGVPVLTSRTTWFDDLDHVTFQPDDLIEGVSHLLEDEGLRCSLGESAQGYCLDNSWARSAHRHQELWEDLKG